MEVVRGKKTSVGKGPLGEVVIYEPGKPPFYVGISPEPEPLPAEREIRLDYVLDLIASGQVTSSHQ